MSTSFLSTLGVQALLAESWPKCVHTLSTRYVTVYTLDRYRLVGSVAGSAPVHTNTQKTCAHTGYRAAVLTRVLKWVCPY